MHPLSPPDSDTFADVLRRTRLAAIVRGQDPDAALRTVLTLAEEGVALVEVSLNTTDALGVIRRAAAEVGPGFVGACDVLLGQYGAGADAVKLFPASLGGPAYLKALRDPFPDMPIVPVGGVDLAGAERYLAHGAVAVGVGSPLVGDAAHGGDLAALRQRARGFVALCSAGTREDV